ncbi:TonB-dependent receptor [Sphingomonas sp. RIT328]|uniref:TonB-dependent receptor n=1 Tax=Sphingomonas sp. RIT328 TaxID=1470591 RepID=UPI00044E51C5|nr:TonB-dependent receptor [Sphingomonas sp. RIT328]EZP48808.1 TonB-dependent Receptor Plug domain protein [Sphingomonas sp. RIT328]
MRNNLFLGVAAVALIAPAAASAQETTSVIRGTVTNAGTPVAGATVTATDVNSGTKSQTSTDATGSFSLPGLRVGGPYTVEVASDAGSKTVTDIYTVLQQDFTLPVELGATADAPADAGGEIVVTARSIRGAGVASNGPATVLTQADVRKVASVNRDIRDIQRRDPFATLDLSNGSRTGGAVSFAGVNPRFNRFTINGVQVGDQFGLNQDASPTGRGPIPYDAIGQVSVSIAPYDFRQGNFQGGVIDAVLLSGTNDFHGTGFYSQNTDGLSGSRLGSNTYVIPKFKSETYGATLRGPLIKDKLFFMVSAERNTDPRPFDTLLSQIPNLTQSQIDNVSTISNQTYNYNPGGVLGINARKDEKIVGRIDANITTGQRLSLSYINAYDSQGSQNNTSVSTTSPSYGLSSNAYTLTELLRAGIVQLNSDWTDKLSTEIRGLYRYYTRGQNPLLGNNFAQFRVCNDPTSLASLTQCSQGATGTLGTPTLAFGPDNSRQTNELFTDTWGGSFLLRYRNAGHDLKFLAEMNENRTFNNFLQNSAGNYYFDSLANFQNRQADQLVYAVPLNGAANGASANFHYDQWNFGIQDDWRITDKLRVSYGFRWDVFGEADAPTYNQFFQARYGYPNTKTYKGLALFQPRISFNYDVTDKLRIRGGGGIFGGGSPDIYLSNSFSNTILANTLTINRTAAAVAGGTATCSGFTGATGAQLTALCNAALNNVTGQIPSAVRDFALGANGSAQLTTTAALAPNFRLPSSWKATLSADYKLFGFNVGADYYFSKVRDGVVFTDIRSAVIGVLPDGRPRYNARTIGTVINGTRVSSDNNYDILLTNTDRGHSHVGVIRFDKQFDWGLSLGGSYTRQIVKDVAAATSSTILSNYGNQPVNDPNYPAYGTSNDQIKFSFKYNVGYDHAFFGDYRTIVQLFGETRAGRAFSYTMQNAGSTRSPVFGTLSNTDRYLLYVPTSTSDPIVSYDSTATQNALDSLINNSALKDYRGKIAGKNIGRSRVNTRIDLHLEQEIPTFLGESRFSIFADISNLPNLINHNWAGLRQLGFPQTAATVQVQCLTVATPTGTTPGAGVVNTAPTQTCAQYRYSTYAQPQTATVVNNSLYAIRLGARFTF